MWNDLERLITDIRIFFQMLINGPATTGIQSIPEGSETENLPWAGPEDKER